MVNPPVSIIIPCKEIDSLAVKCIEECLKLDYSNFEILILPDDFNKERLEKFDDRKIRIIETSQVKPAVKRNLGMEEAVGTFFAFIDSDAYPKKDWLTNAIKYFKNETIGIVGGPQLTPREANFDEHVSGYVLSNFFVSGFANVRYRIAKSQFVKELPSCNYISRREVSPKYKEGILTAEDSKFCFDVARKGYSIFYANDVIVHHHRRDTTKKHLKQMYIYGRDISWLAKEEFSFDMLYFSLLTLFVLGTLIGALLSLFYVGVRNGFAFFMDLYFLIIILTSFHKNLKMSLSVASISVATHFAYGVGFLIGLMTKNKNTVYIK